MRINSIEKVTTKQGRSSIVEKWPESSGNIPIVETSCVHEFNRIVGYACHINAESGTVLYRGQTKCYPTLTPSGARAGKNPVSDTELDRICSDENALSYLRLDLQEIDGWKEYRKLLLEAVLQHYSANTYCMDFVDNHWCALWFGLHEFKNNHYYKRKTDEYLYVFLYLADTAVPSINGVYIGSETYTVDLRKAIPSLFQRPAAQHGWIVRKKQRGKSSLNERVIGIIKVKIEHAAEWLSDGFLLSEENFFPSFNIDDGYKMLLLWQEHSGFSRGKKGPKLMKQNTIQNYHLSEMYYCSDPKSDIKPISISPFKGKGDENSLSGLFTVLLERGWTKETCSKPELWNEDRPFVGQSLTTALIVQSSFGGDIGSFKYSNRSHYYNIINGVVVDLVWSELEESGRNYSKGKQLTKNGVSKLHNKNKDAYDRLIENCRPGRSKH